MKKGIMKRAAASLCAAVLAASMLAGCSQTDYSMTADGEKINAGIYINFLLNEMTNQMSTMYYAQEISDPAEALSKEVDGKAFKTYVKEQALKDTKELAAINAKFDELGLSLSDDDKAAVKDSVASAWESNQEFYESEGIGRESLTQVYELSYKRQAIFDYYYGEGGAEEVTEEELKTYLSDNYIRFKQITFSKSYSEDEDTAKSENEEAYAKAKDYLEQAGAVDYEGFDALIKQHEDEVAAEEEAEDAADEDAADGETELSDEEAAEIMGEDGSDETTETEETSDSLTEVEETLSQAEAETEAETEAEEVEAPADDTEAAETTAAETEAPADETAEETEAPAEDTDGTAATDYDTVVNYTTGTDKESDTYDENYANRLISYKNDEYGTASIYEDD
ncbi:MAG: hypothetical protein IJ723_00305, partial [Ruminococcus sp.]|nr:hypothetical protein [Ruminococcus sp.]